ncbi:MAG: phosphopantetheine-binding protein [Solirubrobacteraceae bacterium]
MPAHDQLGVVGDDVEGRARALADQFAILTGIDVLALPAGLRTPLRSLEIDSLVLIDFLGRTEKQYAFEWNEDMPPETFETLLTIARWIPGETAGASSGGEEGSS